MRPPVVPLLALLMLVVALVVAPPAHADSTAPAFSAGRAGFALAVKDEICPYVVLGVYVLPGERVPLEVVDPRKGDRFSLESEAGTATPVGRAIWDWVAPGTPGLFPLRVTRNDAPADTMRLNVFVMVPSEGMTDGHLEGYEIGHYPLVFFGQTPIARPPHGFVRVTPDNENALLSPHFTLKQFLCKQEAEYPRFVVLRERLLVKLEIILEHMNEAGHPASSFVIMSGYRTPAYNASLKNVAFSRHQWGAAADIFIDENPPDGMMDDLDGNGRINSRDAGVLYDVIDRLFGQPVHERFLGGLARYRRTKYHGPFVHVDVRGFDARWGLDGKRHR